CPDSRTVPPPVLAASRLSSRLSCLLLQAKARSKAGLPPGLAAVQAALWIFTASYARGSVLRPQLPQKCETLGYCDLRRLRREWSHPDFVPSFLVSGTDRHIGVDFFA